MRYFLNNTRGKDIFTGLLFSLAIIIGAVLLVTFCPIIYQVGISSYDLEGYTGLSNAQMVKSLTTICHYLTLFAKEPLQVPYFTLTKETLIHFKDVKAIYAFLQVFFIIDIVILSFMIRSHLKESNVEFLNVTGKISVVIVAFFGFLSLTSFDEAFILMHQMLFRNNYWLIDPVKDPIIRIFPEMFFNHCLIGILFLIVVVNIVLQFLYRKVRHSL